MITNLQFSNCMQVFVEAEKIHSNVTVHLESSKKSAHSRVGERVHQIHNIFIVILQATYTLLEQFSVTVTESTLSQQLFRENLVWLSVETATLLNRCSRKIWSKQYNLHNFIFWLPWLILPQNILTVMQGYISE